jgi:phosphoserine / homoserine phosphotransferase
MDMICLDFEGVLIPEIWINIAIITGIEELKVTTRDIPDYDILMKQRLSILKKHKLTIKDIQSVIAGMSPLPGAAGFLKWLRENYQLVILSDTFYDFAMPFMKQLDYPVLLCHKLEINVDGMIDNYVLRQKNAKRESVRAFQSLSYRVIAAGDSYNDVAMLTEAAAGILFRPPQNVIDEFPQFPVNNTFDELKESIISLDSRL